VVVAELVELCPFFTPTSSPLLGGFTIFTADDGGREKYDMSGF
jgi:hypothetical protein